MPRQSGSTSAHTCEEESKNTDSSAVIFLQHNWNARALPPEPRQGSFLVIQPRPFSFSEECCIVGRIWILTWSESRIMAFVMAVGLKSQQLQRRYMESKRTLTRLLTFWVLKEICASCTLLLQLWGIKCDLLMLLAEKLPDIQSLKYLSHHLFI